MLKSQLISKTTALSAPTFALPSLPTTTRAPRKPTKPSRKPTKPTRKPAAPAAKSGTSAGARSLAATITTARKVTSAMKKRFDALVAKMAIASRDEARGWDSYFEYMGEILREKLWIAGGYDSSTQWLESVSDDPLRSLRRNVRVAESSSPDEQVKFTRSKITLALTLLDARDAAAAARRNERWEPSDEPRAVDWKALRFDVVRDGKKKSLALAEITAPELQVPRRDRPTAPHRAFAAVFTGDTVSVVVRSGDEAVHARGDEHPTPAAHGTARGSHEPRRRTARAPCASKRGAPPCVTARSFRATERERSAAHDGALATITDAVSPGKPKADRNANQGAGEKRGPLAHRADERGASAERVAER
jgi:hypothetical protein